jgi:hypothetical protein
MNQLPADQVATILVDAMYRRDDADVAKRYRMSVRTLERYRARMLEDPELTALVAEKSKAINDRVQDELIALVREATLTATELVKKARRSGKPEHLHSVIGALKIAREGLAEEAILNGSSRKARPNSPPPAPAGGTGAGARGAGTGTGATAERTPIN